MYKLEKFIETRDSRPKSGSHSWNMVKFKRLQGDTIPERLEWYDEERRRQGFRLSFKTIRAGR